MTNKILFTGLLIILFFCCVCSGRKTVKDKLPIRISIEELTQNPKMYLDSFVIVSGLLINRGTDYFKDLRVVLEDSLTNAIPVIAWLPIEIPPAQDPSIPRPKTLRDYLDKRVELRGYLRHGKSDAFADHEYYLEVKEGKLLQKE